MGSSSYEDHVEALLSQPTTHDTAYGAGSKHNESHVHRLPQHLSLPQLKLVPQCLERLGCLIHSRWSVPDEGAHLREAAGSLSHISDAVGAIGERWGSFVPVPSVSAAGRQVH